MTPAELAAVLSAAGPAVTVAAVHEMLTVHRRLPPVPRTGLSSAGQPAFLRLPAGRWLPVRPPNRSWAPPAAWPSRSAPSLLRRPQPGKGAQDERVCLAGAE